MHFGLLQKFKHLFPTVRDLAVPFHPAVPRLALSSPKDLRFFRESSILSLGERVLNWTSGKHSRTGTAPQSCLLLVKEGGGHLAWAFGVGMVPCGTQLPSRRTGQHLTRPGLRGILDTSPGEAGRAVALADPKKGILQVDRTKVT